MQFLIADTFTDSLARLTGAEQKAVKTTAFDLQMDPSGNGLSFHKLDKAKDKNFWSLRVSSDIRLIVHRSAVSLLLCYVDHHDKAYAWAERRKLETHPTTGAAQLVEIRERVQEITIPVYTTSSQTELSQTPTPAPAPKPALFADVGRDQLLSYGVPEEWLSEALRVNEDSLFDITSHLPAEAAEALLELATGGTPQQAKPAAPVANPFAHPDAMRRFRIMDDAEALEQAFAYPWDKWTIFLHPAQRQLVDRDYSGPARASGSAGTGKSIVALHRAAYIARHQTESRVLLTTFSDTLANALQAKLARLISSTPRLGERLEVHALNAVGERLYERNGKRATIAGAQVIRKIIADASATVPKHSFRLSFLVSEWNDVIDAWQLDSWEAYRDIKRLGRKTRLSEPQRASMWAIAEIVRRQLATRGLTTHSALFHELALSVSQRAHPPFDAVVVDECQDLSVAQMRFLAALGNNKPNGLFFAGDLGQRIFQQPFSWKSLGVDIRGRSHTLRINYRTSHQIRRQADRLLGPEISDIDGITEDRRGTQSVFNGTSPVIQVCDDEQQEIKVVTQWILDRVSEGIAPGEIGIFVRSDDQMNRARQAATAAKLPFTILDERVATLSTSASISTMHLAKGLEFRAVAVMACDDEVLPLQSRIAEIGDDADLEEVYHTERHLLYVACTRARDHLLVTGIDPASEFLEDMQAETPRKPR